MTRIVFGIMAIALSVTLVACGGSDDGSEPEPAATTAAAEADDASTGATPAAGGQLTGTVGPGFTITLTQDGAPVTELAAGTYEIAIEDKASTQNFHLTGPNVDEATDVGEEVTTTWTLDLAPGEYTYVCDPHASSMTGGFTVT
jgi:plastocyanin